jgi:SAM-dependent methyltransferase
MKEYTGFAYSYDMFMDNVPYDEWAEYLHDLLIENGVKDGIVCELGCGTGKMTRKLRDFGYDMIGIDLSQEMLQIAIEQESIPISKKNSDNATLKKERKSKKNPGNESGEILYLNQDMREFELYGSVAAVVSVCDSMNYITEKEDLLQVFKLVNNYLDPGGVFIFDMNTPYYYRKKLGEQTICDNRDEGSLIWENYYDAETKINEFDITIYIRRNTDKKTANIGNSYERYEETHYQRAYSISEVKGLLKKARLTDIRAYEVLTKNESGKCTERVYFVSHKMK